MRRDFPPSGNGVDAPRLMVFKVIHPEPLKGEVPLSRLHESKRPLPSTAKLNGHEPWAYLRDVFERLPGHPNSRIAELLPHRWKKPDA